MPVGGVYTTAPLNKTVGFCPVRPLFFFGRAFPGRLSLMCSRLLPHQGNRCIDEKLPYLFLGSCGFFKKIPSSGCHGLGDDGYPFQVIKKGEGAGGWSGAQGFFAKDWRPCASNKKGAFYWLHWKKGRSKNAQKKL